IWMKYKKCVLGGEFSEIDDLNCIKLFSVWTVHNSIFTL
ncbi:uncharacterized protein METZ01_LOCUS134311, partial [marine metagenome]